MSSESGPHYPFVYGETEQDALSTLLAYDDDGVRVMEKLSVGDTVSPKPITLFAKRSRWGIYQSSWYPDVELAVLILVGGRREGNGIIVGECYGDFGNSISIMRDIFDRMGNDMEKMPYVRPISDPGDDAFMTFLSRLQDKWGLDRFTRVMHFANPVDAMEYSLLF